MPTLDGDDRVVGVVLREHPTTGNYIRSYLVLDFSTHKLRMYPEQVQLCTDLSQATCDMEINCQYITKVGGSSTRPKVLNSLGEILICLPVCPSVCLSIHVMCI